MLFACEPSRMGHVLMGCSWPSCGSAAALQLPRSTTHRRTTHNTPSTRTTYASNYLDQISGGEAAKLAEADAAAAEADRLAAEAAALVASIKEEKEPAPAGDVKERRRQPAAPAGCAATGARSGTGAGRGCVDAGRGTGAGAAPEPVAAVAAPTPAAAEEKTPAPAADRSRQSVGPRAAARRGHR